MKSIDILNNKLYLVLVGVLFFVFWMFGFLLENTILVENIALLIIGLLVCASLIFTNKINNILIFLLLVPFMFARPLDPLSIPVMIYVACGLLVVGFVVHFIKTKPKFKQGTLLYGLCFLGLGMILGGISMKADFILYQVAIMLFVVIMFVIVYIYFTSTSEKIEFENIAFMITVLGVFISLQGVIFYLTHENLMEIITEKVMNVGWGSTNNIALMLLLTFPFTFYLYINANKSNVIPYLFSLILQAIIFIFTYSRGGYVAFAIELLLIFIFTLIINKANKIIVKRTINLYASCFALIVLLVTGIFLINKEYFNKFIDMVSHFDLDSLNGRLNVYKEVLKDMKSNLFFGKGVLFSMFTIEDEIQTYTWGHSTIIQTFTTMGILGTLGLLYHFFEKYYVLLRKPNPEKIVIFLSFLGSGLYGLVDVSYYFINYMVVLVVIFIVCEPYFYNWKLENDNKIIKSKKTLEN